MSASRERLICQALDEAIQKGVVIHPGAAFDWTNSPDGLLPSRCNAIGALELKLGRTKEISYLGFTGKVCDYLEVGTVWLYRFHIGFDQGRLIHVNKTDCFSGFSTLKICQVSKLGMKVRNRYLNS